MKEKVKSIINIIFIILPLPVFILLVYEICHSNYIVQVNNDNIDIIEYYLENENIKINSNIKEIKLYTKVFRYDLNIIYDNNEIENYSYSWTHKIDLSESFIDYIIKHNSNHIILITGFAFLISISICDRTITKLKRIKIEES